MNLPTYSLAAIKNDFNNGNYVVTTSALTDSISIDLNPEDIVNIGMNLQGSDFYKTMGSIKFPTRMQDVYRTNYKGIDIYYKVQRTGNTIVISCKRL